MKKCLCLMILLLLGSQLFSIRPSWPTELNENNKLLADALKGLQQTIIEKIEYDADTTATAFADAEKIDRDLRLKDIFRTALVIVEETINTIGSLINAGKLAENANQILDSSEANLQIVSSIMSITTLKQVVENLQLAIDGPTYCSNIENMLDKAYSQSSTRLFFNYDAYRNTIKDYLYAQYEPGPLRIPHKTTDVPRRNLEIASGTYEIERNIRQKFRTLRDKLEDNPLSPDSALQAINQIEKIKRAIVASKGSNQELSYETYLKDKTGSYVPNTIDVKLGSIADLEKVRQIAFQNLDKELMMQQITTISRAARATVGATTLYIHTTYKSPKTGEVLGEVQNWSLVPSMIEVGISKVFDTNAREQINMIPQEMMMTLPLELSNVWMVADDTTSYIEYLIKSEKQEPPKPVPPEIVQPEEISGSIYAEFNDHWGVEGNVKPPIIVKGSVTVEPDTILTIDPGTIIIMTGDIVVKGTLIAKGVQDNWIIFWPLGRSGGKIKIYGDATIEYCYFDAGTHIRIIESSPIISHNIIIGEEQAREQGIIRIYGESSSPKIIYNFITGGTVNCLAIVIINDEVGSKAKFPTIEQNVIKDNNCLAIMVGYSSWAGINKNILKHNAEKGILIHSTTKTVEVTNNLVTGGNTGICVSSPGPIIKDNAIYDNSQFNLIYSGGQKLAVENNYWGAERPDATKFKGNIDFVPWLKEPPVELPIEEQLGVPYWEGIIATWARMLKSEDEQVRYYVAEKLYKKRDKRAVPVLQEMFREEPSIRLTKMLLKLGGNDALAELLKDENREVQWYAAERLHELGDKRALPVLKKLPVFSENFDSTFMEDWDKERTLLYGWAKTLEGWTIQKGVCCQAIGTAFDQWGAFNGEMSWGDYIYEVDVWPGEAGDAFLFFRAKSPPDLGYYQIELEERGLLQGRGRLLRIYLSVTKEGHSPRLIDRYDTLRKEDLPHQRFRVKIVARGPHIKIYFDDKLVIDCTDHTHSHGRIGIGYEGYTSMFGDICFDNLKVVLLDKLKAEKQQKPPKVEEKTQETAKKEEAEIPHVTARVSNADDKAVMYVNGQEAISITWGTGPGGKSIGHRPGDSGWVDITPYLGVGDNTLRFWVWNKAVCCGVSGTFEVQVDGSSTISRNFQKQDSTEGVKYDETVVLSIPKPQ